MRERVKIRRHGFVQNYLTTVWSDFSPIGLRSADLEFKTHAQLAKIFIPRNREKQNITASVQVQREIALFFLGGGGGVLNKVL